MLYQIGTAWCLFMILLTMPSKARGQYFSLQFDTDSLSESGKDIFIQNDGSYFITGAGINVPTYKQWLFAFTVSATNNQVLSTKELKSSTVNYFMDYQGRGKQDKNGNYILPFTIQTQGASSSRAGYCKVTNDSILTRTYTDTTTSFDITNDCALAASDAYLIGGETKLPITIPKSSCFLKKVDTSGNLLWAKMYVKDTNFANIIQSICPLDNGKILIGACVLSHAPQDDSFPSYAHRQPWFFITDSSGNILKEAMPGYDYMGGGNIFKDINGGYFHWGALRQSFSRFYDWYNFPEYLAHLDDGFHIQWMTKLTQYVKYRYISISTVEQTNDSCYIVIGTVSGGFGGGNYQGGVIKVNKNGQILWSHRYTVDSTLNSSLLDGVERSDHSFLLVGNARSSVQPLWHYYDTWLLSIDSNGCELPGGCTPFPTAIPQPPKVEEIFTLYPNPTNGSLHCMASEPGTLEVFTLQGVKVQSTTVSAGSNQFTLGGDLPASVYILRYLSSNGKRGVTKQIVLRR